MQRSRGKDKISTRILLSRHGGGGKMHHNPRIPFKLLNYPQDTVLSNLLQILTSIVKLWPCF